MTTDLSPMLLTMGFVISVWGFVLSKSIDNASRRIAEAIDRNTAEFARPEKDDDNV